MQTSVIKNLWRKRVQIYKPDQHIIENYIHHKNAKDSDLSLKSYCKKQGANFGSVKRIGCILSLWRVRANGERKPIFYEYKNHVLDFESQEILNLCGYCKVHNLVIGYFKRTKNFLHYTSVIEKYELGQGNLQTMKFIEVSPKKLENPVAEFVPPSLPAEVIKNPNQLEIILGDGIKVQIAGNVESSRIIKIIELLKEL